MPIAGALADKFPVGRIAPVGLAVIVGAMFWLSTIEADTSYGELIFILFLLGLGMGGTMMPIMTTALRTLQSHEVARGSTLLNITQQIASSVGVAVISVVLTNGFKDSNAVQAAQELHQAELEGREPANWATSLVQQLGDAFQGTVLADMASAFGTSFLVAAILCLVTFVVSLFLPKKHEESHLLDDQGVPPVAIH